MSEQTVEKTDVSLRDMTLEQLPAKAKEDNNPWLPAIGIFQESQVFDEWQQAICDYRRSVDENPGSLAHCAWN